MKLYTVHRAAPGEDPVVCIHGLLGSSRNVFRLTEAIHKAGFDAWSYDQRGHGHSPHGDPNSYTLRQLAQDAIDLLQEQGLKKAHLVGHSLGGRVSLQTAILRPDLVKTLTILDIGIHGPSVGLEEIKEVLDPMPDFFVTREEGDAFLNRFSNNPGMKQFLKSNLRERDGRLVWLFDLHGIKTSLLHGLRIDFSEGFKHLICPIHILRGQDSTHFQQSELEEMLSLNKNAEASVIPNAGHWLHVDNFVETSSSVIHFLEKNR